MKIGLLPAVSLVLGIHGCDVIEPNKRTQTANPSAPINEVAIATQDRTQKVTEQPIQFLVRNARGAFEERTLDDRATQEEIEQAIGYSASLLQFNRYTDAIQRLIDTNLSFSKDTKATLREVLRTSTYRTFEKDIESAKGLEFGIYPGTITTLIDTNNILSPQDKMRLRDLVRLTTFTVFEKDIDTTPYLSESNPIRDLIERNPNLTKEDKMKLNERLFRKIAEDQKK